MAQIEVTIIEGRNLKKKDLFSENDAFVEIYLDDKNEKQKTKVEHNSKSPKWNQTLVFNHLHGQDSLHIDVYDEDRIGNDRIGSGIINLKDLYEKGHIDNWFSISSRCHDSSQGEIHLLLKYQPLRV